MKFRGTEKKNLDFQAGDADDFINFIRVLTIGDLSIYPPGLSYLTVLYSFSLKLIEKSAYVPDIISLKEKSYIVRWIPALSGTDIRSVYSKLCGALAPKRSLAESGG